MRAEVRAEIARLRQEIADLEILLDALAPERPARKRRRRPSVRIADGRGQSLLEKIGAER